MRRIIFPTFKVSATGLKRHKYPVMKAVQARMTAQIQADEDQRIFDVLDGMAPVVHLLVFLLETNDRLVAEYYPELKRCGIRLVPETGMGTMVSSRRIIDIVYFYDDDDKVSWCSHVPNAKKGTNTLAERLCWHVSRAIYDGTNSQSIKYFERERSNHLWHEFVEETRKQQLIASMMVS